MEKLNIFGDVTDFGEGCMSSASGKDSPSYLKRKAEEAAWRNSDAALRAKASIPYRINRTRRKYPDEF